MILKSYMHYDPIPYDLWEIQHVFDKHSQSVRLSKNYAPDSFLISLSTIAYVFDFSKIWVPFLKNYSLFYNLFSSLFIILLFTLKLMIAIFCYYVNAFLVGLPCPERIVWLYIYLAFKGINYILRSIVAGINIIILAVVFLIQEILNPINIFFFHFTFFIKHILFYFQTFVIALKINILVFFFLWVRASVPRYRYDTLMAITWKIFLPFSFAFFLLTTSLLYI